MTLGAVPQRGEELIEESFSAVATRLKAPLDACMEAARQTEAVSLTRLIVEVLGLTVDT